MAVRDSEYGEYWGRTRTEWSIAVPASLILLVVLLSPLLYDLLNGSF